jgi:quinol monooxygenase YgiN
MTANSDEAIRKTVFLTAKPGLHEELKRALIQLQNATRPEPGCRFFAFYQALDDSSSFVLAEDFVNAAAMETHMGLPHTKAFFAAALVAGFKVFIEAQRG